MKLLSVNTIVLHWTGNYALFSLLVH